MAVATIPNELSVPSVADSAVADGARLRKQLAGAQLNGHFRALGLLLPLFLFILLTFVYPIGRMLVNSFVDQSISSNLPTTMPLLSHWDGKDLPDESVFQALVTDFAKVRADNNGPLVGKRLNYEISGIRSKIISSINKAEKISVAPFKEQLIAADKIWGDRLLWMKLKSAGQPTTGFYLLGMLDLERNVDGTIVPVAADRAIYRDILFRTLFISLTVTLLTLILGFPVAFVLANTPPKLSSLLMIFVLLPFWTSLLVRTTAWYVVLGDQGVINGLLHWVGITSEPLRLIFSRFGTVVAMTHIQLPFTLLPIYSVMKGISPTYMRAARSLGGGPVYSFWRVYLPQTLPGIGAGCLLTFILSLGYYITPALVGGPADQMISGVIADAINRENNWGKACALGAILLTVTLILYWVYNKLVGIDKVKLG